MRSGDGLLAMISATAAGVKGLKNLRLMVSVLLWSNFAPSMKPLNTISGPNSFFMVSVVILPNNDRPTSLQEPFKKNEAPPVDRLSMVPLNVGPICFLSLSNVCTAILSASLCLSFCRRSRALFFSRVL